ncbi:MAG TPA: TonB-dependent receptor [Steroidobacteraceae bacterium]|nr:TonB-dependent receptor [Steroidobacteraceae bacterium]
MRIARSTLIGTAVAMALFGRNEALQAQQASGAAPAQGDLQEVVITGIRASVEESLTVKKKSTDVVEVVTAEDIGKMPDKNIADSLSHVPGVTVSSAGANEGGFDENDRVSLRGTGPSLTQTLIDGHNVASGDWFVLNQTGTVGRSISYTLLPSELVSRVVVQKSSEADLVEGGVAGTVDIITRKPLDDFNKQFTVQASAGAVYADLPAKSAPQFSALMSWRNSDSTFGILGQGFYEDRYLRRDGTEILGYDQFAPCSQTVTGIAAGTHCPGAGPVVSAPHPDLANVWYPHDTGSALFEQERKRTGGLLNVQLRPSDAVDLDLSGFYSKLEAPDYNRNYLQWDTHFVNFGNGQAPDPGYTVVNNTLTKATFTGVPGTFYGVYDQISRPDEAATSEFVNLDGHFKLSDKMKLDGQIGWSEGHGKTPTQNVSETLPGAGAGAFWTLNGTTRPPDWGLTGVNYTQPFPPGNPGALTFGWIFGGQNIDTLDKEIWAKLDATWDMSNSGAWQDLRFGARYSKHDRSSIGSIAQGPTFSCNPVTPTCPPGGGTDPLAYPTTYSNYPSNYTTFGSNVPTGIWYWTPAQLAAYNGPGLVQRDPVQRAYPPQWFALSEPDEALYVQADFKGDAWTANIGVRYVKTTEDTINYIPMSCTATIPASANPCPANTPNLVSGSLFGAFAGVPVNLSYDNVLPSWNFRYQFSPELIGHLAAAQTMTRPDYSALSSTTSLTPPGNFPGTGSGSGSNPYLKPIVSSNFDATLEWYFAPRSLLSGSLFVMDLQNYVGFGTQTLNYPTTGSAASGFPQGVAVSVPYQLTVPINATGRAQGIELTYQQSFGNFGVNVNYTYTDAKQTSDVQPNPDGTPGDSRLVGASRNVYNVGAYYETVHFSARVSYNYRSAFYSGLDRSTAFSQDDTGDLNASVAYLFNDNLSVTLDGMNLNDPTLKYYALNTDQPRAFYKNGRQYYLTLRAKF